MDMAKRAVVAVIFLILLSGVHAYGKAVIVSDVEGLGKYTPVKEPVFQPGDRVKLYVEVNDIDHAGFAAVDIYMIVYTRYGDHLEVRDVQSHTIRYRHHVKDAYVTFEFDIPETWEEGDYFVKVVAYDVADEKKVREMYAKALDKFNPDFGAAKSFLSQPEGIDVGGYGGFLKTSKICNSSYSPAACVRWDFILSKVLTFKVVKEKKVVIPGKPELKPITIKYYPANITYYVDSQLITQPKFLADKPFTVNITLGEAVHDGVVALDYLYILTTDKGEPIYYETSRDRYIRYSGKEIFHTFTYTLPQGKYYLIVKIYDRANPEPLKEFLNSFLKYTGTYDFKKINAYRSIKEGRDVSDAPYSQLGLLKPKTEDNLVYFARLPIEVRPEIVEKNITTPIIKYLSLEPSDFIVNISQPFTVKVKLKNFGKEGTVDVVLKLRGEEKGYVLRQSVFAPPNIEKEVVFNVTLPLTEGAWKITVENSTLSEVILVQKPEVVEKLQEKEKELEELLAPPPEVSKPKLPIAILGMLIFALVALRFILKRRHEGEVPKEFDLPIKITIALQLILLVLYLVYYFK